MRTRSTRSAAGFSLIELLVAMGVLLVVTSIAMTALLDLTRAQTTIWNRTEMHSGIRGATELMQQEVGQAGRIAVPTPITLTSPVTADTSGTCDPEFPTQHAVTANVSSTTGLFASTTPPVYELLTVMDNDKQETVKVASFDSGASTISACFGQDHNAGVELMPLGSFATGIIPKTGIVNGSTGKILKMFGDINGDGNMVYVEYVCDTDNHKLYRNVMAFDAGSKPTPTDSQVLLSNLVENPGDADCFQYQEAGPIVVQGTPFTFVLDVAITLSVQTDQIDPVTRQYQTETKALLNVSPRNVLYAWMLVGMGYTDRVQSTPATVTNLLADS
jgi:prepilin-type N-terminal cleavage/methylation domain-containing protein